MTREEAIEVLQKNYPDSCYSMLREAVDIAIKALSADRPTGKWIPKLSSEDKVKRYECSMCGYVHIKHPYTVEFYCPNCGTDMRNE